VSAPEDIEETLAVRPLYNKRNKFFEAASLSELLERVNGEEEQARPRGELERIPHMYKEFS